jgi:SM-20-related protein
VDAREVSALGECAYFVRDGFVGAELVRALRAEADALHASGRFAGAGVGHLRRAYDTSVRSDEHVWLEPAEGSAFSTLHARLADLGEAMRKEAYLGVDGFDFQLARYSPGAAYARHRDAFRDRNDRRATAIVYLNPSWTPEAGGQLRLHIGGSPRDVEPVGGRLVVFLSEAVEHEVLPAQATRYAATAWYRGPRP